MNRNPTPEHLLELYDRFERRGPSRKVDRREEAPHRIRSITIASLAWVVWSDLANADVGAVLEDERIVAKRNGLTIEWKHYAHDAPADLLEQLAAHGWEPDEPEALLAAPVEAVLAACDPPDAVVLHPGPDKLEQVGWVLRSVYGNEGVVYEKQLRHELEEAPDEVDVVAAMDEAGRVASVGWSWYKPGSPFVTLWGGTTAPKARGRGLYRAVLVERLREAQRRGRSYATVDAGAMSRPILERCGFELLTITTPCLLRPN